MGTEHPQLQRYRRGLGHRCAQLPPFSYKPHSTQVFACRPHRTLFLEKGGLGKKKFEISNEGIKICATGTRLTVLHCQTLCEINCAHLVWWKIQGQ